MVDNDVFKVVLLIIKQAVFTNKISVNLYNCKTWSIFILLILFILQAILHFILLIFYHFIGKLYYFSMFFKYLKI